MKYLLKLCLVLTEASSIVLLALTLIYIVSGYGLIKTSIVRKITFGLINRHIAELIHTDLILRVLFSIFLIIHCLSGITLMLHRRIRYKTLRYSLLLLVTTLILYFTVPLLLVDLLD